MKLIVRSSLYVLVLTLLLGGIYPAVVFALGQLLWRDRANGSFVESGGRLVGSELIGQNFQNPGYLHSRPSAAGKNGYDPTSSGGTNKGPTDAGLAKSIATAVGQARKDRPGDPRPVPADLVTSSISGVDPHLSPDAALWQVARIAKARRVSEEQVAAVIRRHVEPRTLGFLGDPRVNVLLTNLDLDRTFGAGAERREFSVERIGFVRSTCAAAATSSRPVSARRSTPTSSRRAASTAAAAS